MKTHYVFLVVLMFALIFVTSCKDSEKVVTTSDVQKTDETKSEDAFEPPVTSDPPVKADPPVEDSSNPAPAIKESSITEENKPDPSNVEGPYPEQGFNSSLGLGGNIGGGGGPGGGGGGFRYRRAYKPSSSENYESPYPGDDNADNTEKYSDYSINKFTKTSDSVFSTFAIDVDTASYTVMRSKIKDGKLPDASSVRVEEYINYFDYNYPAPSTGLFTVHSQIAENPFNGGETQLLRVAMRAKDISNDERKTAHLTFLIDVSGSMGRPNKLPLVKETLKLLVENLRGDDTIGICTYASSASKLLPPTPISEKEKILAILDSLGAGGATAGEDGLKNAYEMADASFNSRHINRIILCTDGDFNVGDTEGKSLSEAVNKYAQKGITISAVGYGMGNYKDNTLESIANASNGNYFYVDSVDEVKKVFGENLVSTLDVVAADVKIQLEFNPNVVKEFRLVGYETRALKTEDFRNDIIDAGEVGPGHSVTAIYELVIFHELDNELKVPEDMKDFAAMFRIRYKEFITDEKAYEVNFGVEDKIRRFDEANQSFKFAVGVMGFADILRESPYAKTWKINTAMDCCNAGFVKSDERASEFIELLKKAISLRDK